MRLRRRDRRVAREKRAMRSFVEVIARRPVSIATLTPPDGTRLVMPSPNMRPTRRASCIPAVPPRRKRTSPTVAARRGPSRSRARNGSDGQRLAAGLEDGLAGIFDAPARVRADVHKHAKQRCGGVQIRWTDHACCSAGSQYVALVAIAHSREPAGIRSGPSATIRRSHPSLTILLIGYAEEKRRAHSSRDETRGPSRRGLSLPGTKSVHSSTRFDAAQRVRERPQNLGIMKEAQVSG